jgi:hypothetical protein
MMDPGQMGAPMPPEAAMGAAAPMPKAAEMVVLALQAMQAERQGENDAVIAAVMAATQGAPSGLGGVTEGAPVEVPGAEMGGY